MKNKILFIALLSSYFQATISFADCLMNVPKKTFEYDSYTIQFDFSNLLAQKHFKETTNSFNADYELQIEGNIHNGKYFQFAHSTIRILKINNQTSSNPVAVYSSEYTKRCYTQFCTIRDFQKSFQESYQQIYRSGPECKELSNF